MSNLFWNRLVRWGLVLVFTLLVGVEIGVRYAGYGDFPLFAADNEIGYLPQPSQSGVFAGDKDWVFNERSMLNGDPFQEDRRNGILVLGDSIVWGGVAYTLAEKLGPQLQASLGEPLRVWSIGAGSWALLNELTWLERNPDVVKGVSQIVWIVNKWDFGARSQWASELTHPKQRPVWLGGYLASKVFAVRGWWPFVAAAPLPEQPDLNPEKELLVFGERLRTTGGPKITIVWYPSRDDLSGAPEPAVVPRLRQITQQAGIRFYDLGTHPSWDVTAYKDTIHPTAEGNRRLARILADLVLGGAVLP